MTVRHMVSSKGAALPSTPPLRTGHIRFPISGSSLSKHPCDRMRYTRWTAGMVHLTGAGRVEQHPIVRGVTAAMRPPDLVMVVPSRDRGDRFTAVWTAPILALPEVQQGST